MQAINLDTFSLSLLTAKEDILNCRASTDWALFAYDGFTNNLKLFDSGTGGLTELTQKFNTAKPMYGLCSIKLPEVGQPRIVLICWVGEDVDEFRKTECESHVPAVKQFFKEAHAFISASNENDLAEEKIAAVLAKVRPPMERFRRNSRPTEKEETVGTNYRKTNAAMEMRRINRDTFWARAEREEERRKEEEKRKAADERRRLERERVMQETKDAEERDRKMNEKMQMIEEQRKLDAKRQEELRKKEKSRWEVQQREHEEEMRARLRHSESIEKAAEAAVLISQRSMNPREFFRQLSQSSISPGSPRSGKPPFRRYQRSLTDTAFIFERASTGSGPTSPLSPSVTSPFSRTPTSPINRSMSPTSPGFRPITSPKSPRAPVRTPPTSPVKGSPPPLCFLPSLPDSKAPPPQSCLPDLPPAQLSEMVTESSSVVESKSFSVEVSAQEPATIPDAPSAPLPENPALLKASELLLDTCVPSEMEDLDIVGPESPEPRLPSELCLFCPPALDTIVDPESPEPRLPSELCLFCPPAEEIPFRSQDLVEAEEAVRPRSEPIKVFPLIEVDEPIEEEEPEQEGTEETAELNSSEEQPEFETSTSVEATLVEDIEVDVRCDAEMYVVEKTENFVIEEERPDQNGLWPENGTAKDDSSDHSTPEKCTYIVNREENEQDDSPSEEVENEESSADRPVLRVRALYDYQAEDDTEISFEPGDIIVGVETVDEAWWRGYSKDGRQGLFPSNYVETI